MQTFTNSFFSFFKICNFNIKEHDWKLISGKGYDYAGDYYLCRTCRKKIPRYFE